MLVFTLLVLVSYVVLFAGATVCLATGLYYLAELVEEYTSLAKRAIRGAVAVVVVLLALLALVEPDVPATHVALSLLAHGVYASLLKDFPFIALSSPRFVASCALAVATHTLWFIFFTQHYFPFDEILAFFVVCVWLVPFAFFVSLSANDVALPSSAAAAAASSASSAAAAAGGGGGGGGGVLGERKRGGVSILRVFDFLSQKKKEIVPAQFPFTHSESAFTVKTM